MARIASLRAELRSDSAVVAVAAPRLSWIVDDAADWRQTAAEVRCGDETVRLETDESVLVAWPFPPLSPGEERSVRVRAESGDRATPWSEPLLITAGFLGDDGWRAEPIGLPAPERPAQPALLVRDLTIERPVRRALLRWTALGAADVSLNGARVDDAVLSPGWTAYRDRLVHETVDVTALLRVGGNTLAAEVAGAWYTEEYGFFTFTERVYGDQPAFAARLDLEFGDGEHRTIVTDREWLARGDGPVVESGIYAGERIDLRRALAGWDSPEADRTGWAAAAIAPVELPTPEARIAPPVRAVETLPVAEVLTTPSGALVLDFGQNLVGRLRLTVDGPAGAEIVVRHAEVLEDGELSLRPLRRAAATDAIVLDGSGPVTVEPRFTFHGFRYAQLDGWPGEFDPAAVEAVVLHSDLERTGWFASSHPLLDRLHENVVWGMRGNFLSIPTDCPQRDERLGWTGDIQVFAPTASYLHDSHAFLASWLRDLALEQKRADGVTPLVVPAALPAFAGGGPVAAWGDAATVVPWVLHERFADAALLRAQWPSMRAWAEVLLDAAAGTGLWVDTLQLGDWLDPAAPPDRPQQAKVDSDIVASAYLARSLRIVADTAALIGEQRDAERYAEEAERARAAFDAEFVTPSGRMVSDAPTAYALALCFELVVEPDRRSRLADRLAELVRRGGYRIATGFVGTPLVADALSAAGHLAVAERLLLQTECPSWLYPVTMGATTVWERWDSMLPDGSINPGEMTSFNHYALGAVADWLHRVVGGLAPDAPGYRRLRIAPRPLRALDHAETSHRTPYGLARVAWRREGGSVVVSARVPANTTAVVDLPGRDPETVGSGDHAWRFDEPAPARARRPLTLDSSTAAIIDDEDAYRAVVGTLETIDPALADRVRTTVWSRGRSLRSAFLFTPPAVLNAVSAALAALPAPENG